MITVTATRHRHRDSSPRAIDPAAVVETTLLALDKMNECVDAFARRVRDAFETHLAGALPLDALGASGVRGVGGGGVPGGRGETYGVDGVPRRLLTRPRALVCFIQV